MDFIDGGFSASVKIDYMKTYRFSVWAKASDKNCYINMAADISNTEDKGGGAQPNPVFFSGPLPETDKWYLIVGYVLGAGIPHNPTNSGVYDSTNGDRIIINGKEQTLPIFKNKDGAKQQTIRVFMSGGETVGVNAKFFDPRIEIIDGEEQTIDSMLGKMSNMKWIYEWNGTKTEINGSSVLTPKLFTGTIDEITGKHTGIAMGMDVLGNGQNGIVGYSKGDKTFHIKTDGSAIFGKEEKDHIEISSDGIATIPIVKGDRIQANKLVVYYTDSKGQQILDPNTKQPIKTLEVTDRGEVILHPSKFEMLSGIIDGGGSGGDSGSDALVPQLQELGMIFDTSGPKPKFEINATQITTGELAADRLSLYGLNVYKKSFDGNKTDTKTLEVTETGDININAQNFRLCSTNEYGDLINGENINDMVSSIVVDQNTINIISKNINITGMVTFNPDNNMLNYTNEYGETQRTTINGGCIMTDTIKCNQIGAANSWNKAIVKLFGNDCKIDAEENAIRLKWDDYNYIRIGQGVTTFFCEGNLGYIARRDNKHFFIGNPDAGIVIEKGQNRVNFMTLGGTYGTSCSNKHLTTFWGTGGNVKSLEGIIKSFHTINVANVYSTKTKKLNNFKEDIKKLFVFEEEFNEDMYNEDSFYIDKNPKLTIELNEHTPDYLIQEDLDKNKHINTLSLACLNLSNIQELIKRNEELEQRIIDLENKLNGGEI